MAGLLDEGHKAACLVLSTRCLRPSQRDGPQSPCAQQQPSSPTAKGHAGTPAGTPRRSPLPPEPGQDRARGLQHSRCSKIPSKSPQKGQCPNKRCFSCRDGRRALAPHLPGARHPEEPQPPAAEPRHGAPSPPRTARLRDVVGAEEPLAGTEPHGAVRVQQEPREAGGEVLHEAFGDGAQRLLHVGGQLVVVMLLRDRGLGEGRLDQHAAWLWGRGRTLFLMARRRSRTEPPL